MDGGIPDVSFRAGNGLRVPGSDGELAAGTNLWRKGLVYTTRSPGSDRMRPGYRVAAGMKCGLGAWSSAGGFARLYGRVARVAASAGGVVGHSWGTLHGIGVALVVREAGVSPGSEPAAEALLSAGGASVEELTLLSPQSADEIYNEFDFTGPTDDGPITLSYGEPVTGPDFDFAPVVARAERLAATYHSVLRSEGEVRAESLRVVHREWFLASTEFATIHICFER